MRWQGYTLIAQMLDCQVLANGLELFPCVLVVVVLAPVSLHTLQRLLMGWRQHHGSRSSQCLPP